MQREQLPTSEPSLSRKKSLVKPERAREGMMRRRSTRLGRSDTVQRRQLAEVHGGEDGVWAKSARCMTCCLPNCLMCGRRDAVSRQVSLVFVLAVSLLMSIS